MEWYGCWVWQAGALLRSIHPRFHWLGFSSTMLQYSLSLKAALEIFACLDKRCEVTLNFRLHFLISIHLVNVTLVSSLFLSLTVPYLSLVWYESYECLRKRKQKDVQFEKEKQVHRGVEVMVEKSEVSSRVWVHCRTVASLFDKGQQAPDS